MLWDLCCILVIYKPLDITFYSRLINLSAFAVILSVCPCKLALRTCYPSFFVGLQSIDFDKTGLICYLGHIISHNCDDSDDLYAKKTNLIGQVNTILCTFRHVNCSTKTRLVKSYCNSFFGAEIWDMSHNGIEAICVAWRKGIRRIRWLSNTTHSTLTPELCGMNVALVDMFYKRILIY